MVLPKKNILGIKPYIPGRPIEELRSELGILGDILKFNSNENPVGPSPLATKSAIMALKEGHLYPDDSKYALKTRLSQKHNIQRDQIVMGNGSVELIMFAGMAFLSPNDSIMISDHSFIIPKIVASILGCKTRIIPNKNYEYDLDAMVEAIDETTKIIYIDNPNNPTGACKSKAEVDAFLKKVPAHVLVILDEAYYEYAKGGDYPESGKYVEQGKNVLVLRTFSKIYGLAGLRVGYGFSTKGISDALMKVRMPFNVNRVAHVAALAALNDQEHVKNSIDVNNQGLGLFYEELDKLGIEYVKSRANFVFANFPKDAKELFVDLRKMGLVARTVKEYGFPNSLRITVATEDMNRKFFEGLKKVL